MRRPIASLFYDSSLRPLIVIECRPRPVVTVVLGSHGLCIDIRIAFDGIGFRNRVMFVLLHYWCVASRKSKCNNASLIHSFSAIVTFKTADALRDAAAEVPLDRTLVETDLSYLAPIPHLGRPNYPSYTRHVVEKIAELRGTHYDEIAEYSTHNFLRWLARQHR